MRYLIQQSPTVQLWLDGYDGDRVWEWNSNRKSSWHFLNAEAQRKLVLVHKVYPDAFIIEA